MVAGAQALQQLSSEVIDDICRAGTTIVPGSACNGCFRFDSEVLAAVDVPSGSDCCLEDMARSCLELLDAVSSQWALLEAALGEVSQVVVCISVCDIFIFHVSFAMLAVEGTPCRMGHGRVCHCPDCRQSQ